MKHIIWDYNGTLLDDLDIAHEAMVRMQSKRGMEPMDRAHYQSIITFPISAYYIAAGFDFDVEPFAQLADDFVANYHALFPQCNIHKDAVPTLDYFQSKGYTQSVLTAGPQDKTISQLDGFGILSYFTTVTGDDNHHASGKIKLAKPHMNKLQIQSDQVVFIGDTTHDMEVAQAIGCRCILVAFGHQDRQRLKATGCPVAESFQDIIHYVEQMV